MGWDTYLPMEDTLKWALQNLRQLFESTLIQPQRVSQHTEPQVCFPTLPLLYFTAWSPLSFFFLRPPASHPVWPHLFSLPLSPSLSPAARRHPPRR